MAFRHVNPKAEMKDVELLRQDIQNPTKRRHIEKRLRDVLYQDLRVICCSLYCDNFLMWAHYGGGGRTFCAVFDIPTLETIPPLKVHGPVQYTDTVPVYRFDTLYTTFMTPLICTKRLECQSENEYRLAFGLPPLVLAPEYEITARKESSGILVDFKTNALRGIILGCRPYPKLLEYARSHEVRPDFHWEQMVEVAEEFTFGRIPLLPTIS